MFRRICIIMVMLFLAGCSNASVREDGLSIVCSAFPQYDWVKNIIGGTDADVRLLTENGEELHSYQPTVADIAGISECDVFIYIGGVSDEWAEKVIDSAENERLVTVNMLESVGMCEAHEHDKGECDEHVWLSLKKTEKLIEKICMAICGADAENADIYRKNTQNYVAEIKKLDGEYEAAVKNAPHKTVVFCDRFPFGYMAEDYGLDYYAAFEGCSADTEAGFETIIALAKKVDETDAPAVLTIENSDKLIAQTVISNTVEKNQEILTIDSCQSVKLSENTKSYLEIMRENLNVLKKVLYE